MKRVRDSRSRKGAGAKRDSGDGRRPRRAEQRRTEVGNARRRRRLGASDFGKADGESRRRAKRATLLAAALGGGGLAFVVSAGTGDGAVIGAEGLLGAGRTARAWCAGAGGRAAKLTNETGAFVGVLYRGVGGVSVDCRNEGNWLARSFVGGPYDPLFACR